MDLEAYIKSELKKRKKTVEYAFTTLDISKQTFYNRIKDAKPRLDFWTNVNKLLKIDIPQYVFDCQDDEELHSQSAEYNVQKTPSINKEHKGVPYFDIDFIGGFDLVLNNQQIQPNFYIDFMPFNDADYYVNVTGKSMGPLIAHGDIVALKRVDDWKSFLLEGEIYAIVTNNGFRTIKIIGAGENPDDYMLIPYNKNDVYKPQPIPKNVITHIFRVKGAMKRFF